MQEIKILNVRFDPVTLEQALKKALTAANSSKQQYFATPNPEMLLEASKNRKFLRILNQSSLNIADGIGILWAAKYLEISKNSRIKVPKWLSSLAAIVFRPSYLTSPLPARVTGTDLMEQICAHTDKKVFLLGAAPEIAAQAAKKLRSKYPKLKIVGTHSGHPRKSADKETIAKINAAKPQILFVAFGAPAQELWIERNLKKLPSVHLAIGVGGAFDFIANHRHRAPKWLQSIGLEWLYRLLQQPSRIRRILNATVKFPIKIGIKK